MIRPAARGRLAVILAAALLAAGLLGGAGLALTNALAPRQGWNAINVCAGMTAGQRQAGVWWTTPIYSPAPGAPYSLRRYVVCSLVRLPPSVPVQGGWTISLPDNDG